MDSSEAPVRFADLVNYFHSTELPQALTISFALLLLLVILPTVIGTILNRIEIHKLGERIPGPDSKGRWGRKSHKKAFRAGGGSVGDPTPFLLALHHEYGPLARFWMGKDLWVSVADPAYATAILETVPGSSAAVDVPLKFVLNSEAMQMKQADDGKHLRLVLRKLFSGEIGASNPYAIVAEAAAEGVQPVTDSWHAAVEGGKEVDALVDSLLLSSGTLLRCLFGSILTTTEAKNYAKHLLRASAGASRWRRWSLPLCLLFPSYWAWKASVFRLSEISWNLIAAVERAETEKRAETPMGQAAPKPPYSGGRGLDLIGHVAHARTGSGFPVIGSKRAMGDQVTALVFGGLAPVASLLVWALYELAKHPEEQRKAAQDVEAACEDGASTEDAVWKADYLAAVLWETLRLHPPQPNIYRKLESPLKIGDIVIPAKTTVVIPVAAMQRDPHVWGPNAASFVPERFVSQAPARSSDEAEVVATKDVRPVGRERLVLAFGQGLRACPGRNIALFEARTILSHLLENFEVELSPGQGAPQSKVQGFVSLPLPNPKLLVKPRE